MIKRAIIIISCCLLGACIGTSPKAGMQSSGIIPPYVDASAFVQNVIYTNDITNINIRIDNIEVGSNTTDLAGMTNYVDNGIAGLSNYTDVGVAGVSNHTDAGVSSVSNYVSSITNAYVAKTGDEMSGILSMGGNAITNISDLDVDGTLQVVNPPVAQDEVARKDEVDDKLDKVNGVLGSDLDFNYFVATNVDSIYVSNIVSRSIENWGPNSQIKPVYFSWESTGDLLYNGQSITGLFVQLSTNDVVTGSQGFSGPMVGYPYYTGTGIATGHYMWAHTASSGSFRFWVIGTNKFSLTTNSARCFNEMVDPAPWWWTYYHPWGPNGPPIAVWTATGNYTTNGLLRSKLDVASSRKSIALEESLVNYVSKSGDIMSGDLNMGGRSITNVNDIHMSSNTLYYGDEPIENAWREDIRSTTAPNSSNALSAVVAAMSTNALSAEVSALSTNALSAVVAAMSTNALSAVVANFSSNVLQYTITVVPSNDLYYEVTAGIPESLGRYYAAPDWGANWYTNEFNEMTVFAGDGYVVGDIYFSTDGGNIAIATNRTTTSQIELTPYISADAGESNIITAITKHPAGSEFLISTNWLINANIADANVRKSGDTMTGPITALGSTAWKFVAPVVFSNEVDFTAKAILLGTFNTTNIYMISTPSNIIFRQIFGAETNENVLSF